MIARVCTVEDTKTVYKYVHVPEQLFENALREKKSTRNLNDYCFRFKYGTLVEHYALCEYIENKIGKFDWCDIERITVI